MINLNSVDNKEFKVAVDFNGDYYYFVTLFDYGLWLPDYTLDPIVLTKEAEAIDLGASLKKAFSRSETTDTKSSYIFDHQENKINYEKNTKKIMALGGYKNKKALFKNMRHCGVRQVNDLITIKPSNHVKLEAWSGECISETDWVIIPASASDEELGHAIIEGFSRCRGRQF